MTKIYIYKNEKYIIKEELMKNLMLSVRSVQLTPYAILRHCPHNGGIPVAISAKLKQIIMK